MRCQRARGTPKIETLRSTGGDRPVFLPPLLLVGSKELVLKVPKRGQFHAAIRVTI